MTSDLDSPVTKREIRTLVEILGNTEMYIPEQKYREKIGISRTQFHNLRKLGRFNNGYHPACLGLRRRLIHEFYNLHSGRIEIPGMNYTEPVTPLRKPRTRNAKKAQKINLGETTNPTQKEETTHEAEQA